MLNVIVVMGRLVRDPELRRTNSGTAVTSFTLAVDRDFKGQDGERETDFIDVVAWKATAEMAAKFFTKGRMAAVKGRLQLRDWTDKNGVKRRTAEIIADTVFFADRRPEASTVKGGVDVPGEFVELDEDEAEADGDLPF